MKETIIGVQLLLIIIVHIFRINRNRYLAERAGRVTLNINSCHSVSTVEASVQLRNTIKVRCLSALVAPAIMDVQIYLQCRFTTSRHRWLVLVKPCLVVQSGPTGIQNFIDSATKNYYNAKELTNLTPTAALGLCEMTRALVLIFTRAIIWTAPRDPQSIQVSRSYLMPLVLSPTDIRTNLQLAGNEPI